MVVHEYVRHDVVVVDVVVQSMSVTTYPPQLLQQSKKLKLRVTDQSTHMRRGGTGGVAVYPEEASLAARMSGPVRFLVRKSARFMADGPSRKSMSPSRACSLIQ